jgi:hypothetical protein
VSALEAIAVTLEAAVTTLQGTVTALQTKVTTLQTQNTDLQSALNAEIAARQAADAALQAAVAGVRNDLDAEVFLRKLSDFDTTKRLASLSEGLNELSGRLDTIAQVGKAFDVSVPEALLVNGADATVARLDGLPAGRYFVIGKALVQNFEHDAGWICHLFRNDEHGAVDALDVTATITEDSFPLTDSHVVMTAVATLPAPGSFRFDCFTLRAGSRLLDLKIVAITVH